MAGRDAADASWPAKPRVYTRLLAAGLWRVTRDELEVRVHCLDSWSERAVRFAVGVEDLRVRHAEAVLHRLEGVMAGSSIELRELCGLTAYLGAGREFHRALADRPDRERWLDLFLEGVRAVIQGEYWLAGERGYASPEEYERYFAEVFADTCLYYSQPPGVVDSWVTYVADQTREDCLFARQRAACLRLAEGGRISAHMIDSFHELALYVELDPEGVVLGAEADINRVPDRVCRLAAARVDALKGLRLGTADRRDLARLLGGPDGCTHLADLAVDAASLARLALSGSAPPERSSDG